MTCEVHFNLHFKYIFPFVNRVNQDTEGIKQEYETNLTRLQASLRISELQVKSLESQLQQKVCGNLYF